MTCLRVRTPQCTKTPGAARPSEEAVAQAPPGVLGAELARASPHAAVQVLVPHDERPVHDLLPHRHGPGEAA
eukprot:CAMPEP_0175521646 /NCGR_PEP_ID=MMETSP0096-20121207/17132_1 /TAXON_ID=311494 /ORGANISM="Alexandrium monilatum, Strain CCMP3105" /LENGTH=71 /DNA_ID=CAMNT_0016824101 /DNA_START=16 /DNA_END=228 /DNA_ORIENTATION=+